MCGCVTYFIIADVTIHRSSQSTRQIRIGHLFSWRKHSLPSRDLHHLLLQIVQDVLLMMLKPIRTILTVLLGQWSLARMANTSHQLVNSVTCMFGVSLMKRLRMVRTPLMSLRMCITENIVAIWRTCWTSAGQRQVCVYTRLEMKQWHLLLQIEQLYCFSIYGQDRTIMACH